MNIWRQVERHIEALKLCERGAKRVADEDDLSRRVLRDEVLNFSKDDLGGLGVFMSKALVYEDVAGHTRKQNWVEICLQNIGIGEVGLAMQVK